MSKSQDSNKFSPQTQIQSSNLPCQTRPAVPTSTNSTRKTRSSRRTSIIPSDKLNPLSRPPKVSDVTWNRLTERNTERNRLYRCKIRVLVIHKDEPRPTSPSSTCEESKILDQNSDMDSDVDSNNDNETDSDDCEGRENDFGDKKVRWNRKELEAPSPASRSSPTTARQKPIIKSCLASANPPTDRLGNVLDADKSLSPIVKRGTRIIVKRIRYNDESE
ncbi:6614_t:CDS:2 [Paraglomus occultum]|uniref:6614_t:CDS:1 n=1 Tax=Paraglomus occultum TaxID=144539 RepID=A0A9N8Z1K5_9GLOM|nr:6614_t:CDS:2 [Paraglomus occultum]